MSNRFNKTSIYALNKKDPDAVVYPTADGKQIRVTCDDFPSEADFLAFKAWSDENFHEEENLEHRESNHTLSMDDLSEAALAVPADDVVMIRRQEQAEKRRKEKELVIQMKDKLTDIQFRRAEQLVFNVWRARMGKRGEHRRILSASFLQKTARFKLGKRGPAPRSV